MWIKDLRPMFGPRVTVQTENGVRYGLVRVRYENGHVNAGHCEVEFTDGDPALIPFEAITPGPNAIDTPTGVTFPDIRKAYRPLFLGDTRLRHVSGVNLTIPGDMEALRELREKLRDGIHLHVTDHDYGNRSGERVITGINDAGMWSTLTPRRKTAVESHLMWPENDFIVDGNTLHIEKPYHAYTGGRAKILTLMFHV
jgi:hypothetical protein